mmetsp:Transcript_11456/g.29051  ORF Transcript_11456/g.29051 Transcript_11456/m.29051 type:complete len:81 (-) Transcript_11456:208-450(-)
MEIFIKLKDLLDVSILHALTGNSLADQCLGLIRESCLRILIPVYQIFSILIREKDLIHNNIVSVNFTLRKLLDQALSLIN